MEILKKILGIISILINIAIVIALIYRGQPMKDITTILMFIVEKTLYVFRAFLNIVTVIFETIFKIE